MTFISIIIIKYRISNILLFIIIHVYL